MSELPEISFQSVAQKLLQKHADQTYQNLQLEVLAESLRDERDTAVAQLADARAEVERLRREQQDAIIVETEDLNAV